MLFRRLPQPWRAVADWALTIGLAVGFVLVFEAEIAKPYRIPSSSMEPTLHCARPEVACRAHFSDRIIAAKIVYRFRAPERGDIAVFKTPPTTSRACSTENSATFVKRIVGLPGETITEQRGLIFVNGRRLAEPYVLPSLRDDRDGTWTVPKGSYFMMGDDRRYSCDSRDWGSVPRKDLIGPVVATYWPPTRLTLR
jgi:signal peptidase I